jgi:hypothetical protein
MAQEELERELAQAKQIVGREVDPDFRTNGLVGELAALSC